MESTLTKQVLTTIYAFISLHKSIDVTGYHIGLKMGFEIEPDLHTSK